MTENTTTEYTLDWDSTIENDGAGDFITLPAGEYRRAA